MLAISTSLPPHMAKPSDTTSSRDSRLPSSTMSSSLAILPSAPVPSSLSLHQHSPTTARRPKLSLNTASASQTRSFGKGASLRLETLSAVSPTARNTFSNAYDAPTQTQGRPSLKLNTSNDNSEVAQDSFNKSTPRYDSATASSASSTESLTTPPPYKLSHHITSILSNSPYPQIRPRKMTTRPFFPPIKRVSFKEPLVEEITNTLYTAKHSDLDTSIASIIPEPPKTPKVNTNCELEIHTSSNITDTSSEPPARSPSPTLSVRSNDSTQSSPMIPSKRDSSDSESEDSCPETPIAGRRKRNRLWRWTLAPHTKSESESESSYSTSSSTSAETSPSDSDSG
ncbi:hypothetical protein EJ05DRAFT_473289 [Pseudovirgaria hyperparasitica]|uniref:Uncharacterized protein n=1 Tax=Pseudovirgaria hyperparasitica TaxID=470096 RepID=A0A6A6WJI6_9PEZI|nr:uncharacterized protein EJ05DRAFT_473289 [Pseudovirgaria hyperparasitica]KAF2762376.1 hypothetical protein EJ05DRAFT_473289 [Pseudovirgaria hyperparasitica]